MFKQLQGAVGKKFKDYKSILNCIRYNTALSKAQLEAMTGLTHSTLNRAINFLTEDGIIIAIETGKSSGGRKPVLYGINPESGYIVGIDISRTYTKVALMDATYSILKSDTFGMFGENTPDKTLGKICEIIQEFCSGLNKEKILGIGIGVVGPINRENGIILNPVDFPAAGWENISISRFLEKRTGLGVIVENGENAAVLGEYYNGYGKGYGNIVYIIAGVGIRSGIIVNDMLVSRPGSTDAGIGRMIIDRNGSLHSEMSINVLLNEFIEALKNGRPSKALDMVDFELSSINQDIFFKAVEIGDELSIEIIKKAAMYFSIAIFNIINIISPEVIILGGPLVKKCDLFYQLTLQGIKDKLNNRSYGEILFSKGALQENAVIVGAGNLVMNYYLK